jgi:aspartate carbamoyltransferase catalytic subunit
VKRHLLSAGDLSRDDAELILQTADELRSLADRPIKKLPALRGRTVVNLFFEDSTRTRISFEAAAKRLSADVINFSAKGSSLSKGESLKDTALTLEAMGADAVVVRHWASGAPHLLANAGWSRSSVINAGDGTHEHPTQALLDAFTMWRHLGDLDGRRVAIVGDVLHSRVARSNALLLKTLGADVTLVGPPTLLPYGVDSWDVATSYNVSKPAAADHSAIPLGISVGGATTVTRAPSLVSSSTLERKTRLWVRSPTMTTCRPSREPRWRWSV